jgi:hypothetical protein
MILRTFELTGLLVVIAVAVIAFLVSVIVSALLGKSLAGSIEGKSGVMPGVEAFVLAVLGGLIARGFISALMGVANDSAGAGLALGWGFFLVPGLIDTLAGHPLLTTPDNLMMIAGIVGAFTGMMAGIYQVYDWEGLGWLAFPLDVTWALAGNSVGALMHLINIGWGDHGDETRENQHRYASGFGLRYHPRYAFTQGSVMSNLTEGPGGDLFRHERTHVWQNRAFGPMYTLTYVTWFVVWGVPAVVVGIAIRGFSGIWRGPNIWCYFNNPWEVWAYTVQGQSERTSIDGVDADDCKMMWPPKYVIAWAVPFFAVCTFLAGLTFFEVWVKTTPKVAPKTAPKAAPRQHALDQRLPATIQVSLKTSSQAGVFPQVLASALPVRAEIT